MLSEALNVRRYWFELALGTIIVGFFLYALATLRFLVQGGEFTFPSLICYLLCFALTSFFLNRQGLKFRERIFYCFATMLAGIALFEIVYHYAFGIPSLANFLHYQLFFFGNQSANGYFSLNWYLVILVVPFIGLKYMKFKWNWLLYGVVIFSALVMFLWIASGYPQYFQPQYFPAYRILIKGIQRGNYAQIEIYGALFNGFAKIIAVIPALLFNKKP